MQKKKRPRDEFNQSTIRTMRNRVASRCSNPGCRIVTMGPGKHGKENNVGKAAHICAAAKGGPRYDPDQTPEQRKSIDNGLWLCSICADRIDNDEAAFPVGLLKEWKIIAEQKAREEQGKKTPDHDDAIQTLTAALGGGMRKPLVEAIANVHVASSKAMESIDPRFIVKTHYQGGTTEFQIHAKEDVDIAFSFCGSDQDVERFRAMEEHGTVFEIDSSAMTAKGSALFDEILSRPGTVSITPNQIEATMKAWFADPVTNRVENCDDIIGAITGGTKSLTFSGSVYGELLFLSVSYSFDQDGQDAKIRIELNSDPWESHDINHLPFFNKVNSFFQRMAQGWKLFFLVEVQGERVMATTGRTMEGSRLAASSENHLAYTRRCRAIARQFGYNIPFSWNAEYTGDDHKEVARVANIIEGKRTGALSKDNDWVSCKIDLSCRDELARLIDVSEPIDFCMHSRQPIIVLLFGTNYAMPLSKFTVTNSVPYFAENVDLHTLAADQLVELRWMPSDGAAWKEEFLEEEDTKEPETKSVSGP